MMLRETLAEERAAHVAPAENCRCPEGTCWGQRNGSNSAGERCKLHPPVPALREADPNGIAQHTPGAKLDAGKMLPWLCISGFAHALSAVADVTTKGAAKYTPNGWTQVADGEARYMEAFTRHTLALARGEQVDADTQCLHKAQMVWNLLASLELELRAANGWARP